MSLSVCLSVCLCRWLVTCLPDTAVTWPMSSSFMMTVDWCRPVVKTVPYFSGKSSTPPRQPVLLASSPSISLGSSYLSAGITCYNDADTSSTFWSVLWINRNINAEFVASAVFSELAAHPQDRSCGCYLALWFQRVSFFADLQPTSTLYGPLRLYNCRWWTVLNPLTPTVAIWVQSIKQPVTDRVKLSFVILTSGHSETLSPEHECPDVKITNDSLTQSGIGCFIVVPIWQQWASKG